MDGTPRPATDAIFNQFKTGAQQRQLILDVTAATLPERHPLREEIGRLCARTADLSGRRNAAVHSDFYIAEFIIPPRIAAAGVNKPSRLKSREIETELASIFRTAVALQLDMQELRLRAIKYANPNFDLDGELQKLESVRQEAQHKLASDPIFELGKGTEDDRRRSRRRRAPGNRGPPRSTSA
jgi:hypothetical protein